MAEFNLHPRLDPEGNQPGDAEDLLSSYAKAYEDVSTETARVQGESDAGVIVPEMFLEIKGVERVAEIYEDLSDDSAVAEVALWGPTAERYPVRVQHYALQQISQPDLYEFHALDGQVTLVIAESEMEAEQLHRDVPAGALG